MEKLNFKLKNGYQANQNRTSIGNYLSNIKIVNPFKAVLLLIGCVCIAYLLAYTGVTGGVLFLSSAITLPIIYVLVGYPRYGVVLLLVFAYLFFTLSKFGIKFPLGTLLDGFEVLLMIGILIQQKKENNWQLFKGPVSYVIVLWVFYNLIEVLNPVAESLLAWVYTIRSVALVTFTYFIFIHSIRTVYFIKLLLKIWIGLSVIAALYGLKQEFIGFSASEKAYLNSDSVIASLLFINGHWRIFSIFSDPVAFSYNMVISSFLCIGLATGPLSPPKKATLLCLVGLFLFAMVFSGTRGAYVLVPVGLLLLGILKYSKKVLKITVPLVGLMAIIILIPTSNGTLYRLQSAFKPSQDASFTVRKENQKRIQPYILAHPMGGGLGATGIWGSRFAPHSYLANFPPDSGYVRVAVELGWIGLLLFCLLIFIILRTSIVNYYRIRDPELKSYCLSMSLIIFALHIGNYPQEAIVQFPSNILFYLAVALINITYRIDREKN